ncbi:MAG TPA: glucose 1-dehydrogenase [Thermomicrobiales bacterium]|nr:glucose 1-dehydrogenase [Thermomicrobiales bacterium]
MSLPTRSRGIAVYPDRPGAIHRTEVEVPTVGPNDVLIETVRVGVCGTDREIIHGTIGAPQEGADELVLGHELLGRVRAIGDAVHDLAEGSFVTATVRRPDSCPACRAGQPDMCVWGKYEERGIVGLHGFMQEHIVERRDDVIPVPDELEPVGVLVEPLTVIEKSLRHVDLVQSARMPWWEAKTALVLGAGPIGILGTMLLRSRGVEVITAARSEQPNLSASVIEGAGATYLSTREASLDSAAKRLGQIDVIIDCSGASGVGFDAMRLLGVNGALVLLSINAGGHRVEIPADAINNGIVAGNKTIIGIVNAGQEDFASAVQHLGRFEELWPGLLSRMFTARIPFDGDVESIIEKSPGSIKTLIEFGG